MEDMMNSVADVLGGPHVQKPPKQIEHIRHRRTKNGGHIFEHHFTHPEHYKFEEHAHDNTDDAVNHFIEHGTDMNPGEEEADHGVSLPPSGQMAGPVPGV